MQKFVVTLSHDNGHVHITTHASTPDAAIVAVKNAEHCPDCSIKSIYAINDSGFLIRATGENAGEMLRIKPDPAEVKITEAPHNPYVTGYGERIPTARMVRGQKGRWHRVYMRIFSNIGTAWVNHPTGYRAIVEV